MFNKLLVSNRGAIASRIIRAAKELGVQTVAVYSDADRDLPYVEMADQAFHLGASEAAKSYLNQARILEVIKLSGADAVHPGYGFLSENASFARAVVQAGHGFVGPDPKWLEVMGHKTRAKEMMAELGMTMLASSGLLVGDDKTALAQARRIGYPILVKPAGGGGGIGMLSVNNDTELLTAIEKASSIARRSFGNADIYLERMVTKPRHIEFQMLADKYGNVRHLYERDCSVQRRHQKVIEEAVAPGVSRAEIEREAGRIALIMQKLGYDVIGTVETLYDGEQFNFLEVNTRLQVEHAVTEQITGVDLVRAQIQLAAGERLDDVLPATVAVKGHAIEVRLYAEDPHRFYPSCGLIKTMEVPVLEGLRTEVGYRQGNTVSPFYDPMIGKYIASGSSRNQAIERMIEALNGTVIEGIKTNIPFALEVMQSDEFKAGNVHTGLAQDLRERDRRAPVVAQS